MLLMCMEQYSSQDTELDVALKPCNHKSECINLKQSKLNPAAHAKMHKQVCLCKRQSKKESSNKVTGQIFTIVQKGCRNLRL